MGFSPHRRYHGFKNGWWKCVSQVFREGFPNSYPPEPDRFLCRRTVHNILQNRKEGQRLKRFLSTFFIISVLLTGCNVSEKPQGSVQQSVQLPVIDRVAWEEAKGIAKENRRVDEVAAVVLKDEIFVGLKVSNFNRFFLRSIRKDVHGRLKEQFPNRAVHVTTDSKLFDELSRLEGKIRENPWGMDREALKRKLVKIHEDMKG
jgi:hypothetical protein